MRLKDLFTVPTGQKVTEKHLRRVLISSICSILLCMTCLVGTTWAWFAVSIENTGNVIQIAQWSLAVSITPTSAPAETEAETSLVQPEDGVYTLKEGTYGINIKFSSDAKGNDLDQANVYLIMVENIGQKETKYVTTFILNENGEYEPIQKTYEVEEGKQVKLSFYITRMNPQIDKDLMTAVFEVEEEETTPETTDFGESTDSTEPPTGDETDPAAGSSNDATSTTKSPTEHATEPSTEPEAATTEPSAETTTIPATEATTAPTTESTTEPSTDETTIPTTEAPTVPVETTAPATEETTIPAETG